jgi:hypothetical protein
VVERDLEAKLLTQIQVFYVVLVSQKNPYLEGIEENENRRSRMVPFVEIQ